MRWMLCLLFSMAICHASPIHARPVSYPGGWTTMLKYNHNRQSAHVHYSLSVDWSVGYKFERWREQAFDFHGAQLNHLVKRWNQRDSQANLYLKTALGVAQFDLEVDPELDPSQSSQTLSAGFIGVAADWENRRYFVSYENRYTEFEQKDGFFMQTARLGWAPYEGDYGDLHTWLMLQGTHLPDDQDSVVWTGLLRLFKGVNLIEIGIDDRGDGLFNYVFRY